MSHILPTQMQVLSVICAIWIFMRSYFYILSIIPQLFGAQQGTDIDLLTLEPEAQVEMKYHIPSHYSCKDIQRELEDEFFIKASSQSLEKYARNLSAEGLIRLLDCNILSFEHTTVDQESFEAPLLNPDFTNEFLNEFADWSNFASLRPSQFYTIFQNLKIDQMTGWALKSFPIPELITKIKKLASDGKLMRKLPMKSIFETIIEALRGDYCVGFESDERIRRAYLNFWKLFNLGNFTTLEPSDQLLLMKYLTLVGPKLHGEDQVSWMSLSEYFMLISIQKLEQYYYLKGSNFEEWQDLYLACEVFVGRFVESRLSCVGWQSVKFPITDVLNQSLLEAYLLRSNDPAMSPLARMLLEQKPVDPNAHFYEDESDEIRNFSYLFKYLSKIYSLESVLKVKATRSFDEFLKRFDQFNITSPLVILQLLSSFSADESEILTVLERYHGPTGIYEDGYQIEYWLRRGFFLNSPTVANFFANLYLRQTPEKLISLVVYSKDKDTLSDPLSFFIHPETGLEMKAALLIRSSSLSKTNSVLTLDFVNVFDSIQLFTTNEIMFPDSESGTLKRRLNLKIRSILSDALIYFKANSEYLKSLRISVKFNTMPAQDIGGPSRYAVTLILKLLTDPEIGLFHTRPDSKVVTPRCLLDPSVLGLVGMLHGQCLKLGIKSPWLLELDFNKQPIKLFDIFQELSSDKGAFPSFEDLMVYVNQKYRLFEDYFDFSNLVLYASDDPNSIKLMCETIESVFWQNGVNSYREHLLESLEPKIRLSSTMDETFLNEINEILKPVEFDETNGHLFLECFGFENRDLLEETIVTKISHAIQSALEISSSGKGVLIQKILNFVTGSSVLPIGFSPNDPKGTKLFTINVIQVFEGKLRKLPQASTCDKKLFWTVTRDEDVEEMRERFLMAVLDSEELTPEIVMVKLRSCRSVDNYKQLNEIEEGTYGLVYRAECKHTGAIVALKKLKLSHEREGFPVTSLREIATLLSAKHPNIVNVREVVVGRELENVFIVMDFMEHDLRTLMDSNLEMSIFTLGESKEIIRQVLSAVEHLHAHWIVHRDLKTSNLLLSNRGIVQVADFGLARRLGPRADRLTPVVVTLWYRAPELLLGSEFYDFSIDMWSVGCILVEILLGRPLLPGKTEIDQIDRIFKIFGFPDEVVWPGCRKNLKNLSNFSAQKYTNIPPARYNLQAIFTKYGANLSEAGYDLLLKCFTYDPKRRITAKEALKHEFFREDPLPKDPSQFPSWPSIKGAKEAHPDPKKSRKH